jgi:predicted TIM-barrel fold metal-dependent hydrolase
MKSDTPFTVDCQSHLFCPEHLDLMRKRTHHPLVQTDNGVSIVVMGEWRRKVLPNHSDQSALISDMDANGIHWTALSVNDPGPEWFDADGPAVAQMLNDYTAGVVSRHPDRLLGLCVLPLQNEKAAQAELDRCVKKLGMRGVLLYTNLAGKFPDEPQFRWLFHRAVELDIPVLLHPPLPITASLVSGYEMISTLGNMFDDTIGLSRLILSGLLDELPKLKLVCPHLGGTLPYIIGRMDHQVRVLKRGPKYLTRLPSEYLKQVWLDIVSPLPLAMRYCYDMLGPERLLFSSDRPWVAPADILGYFHSLKLPLEDEALILGQNARRLFSIPG